MFEASRSPRVNVTLRPIPVGMQGMQMRVGRDFRQEIFLPTHGPRNFRHVAKASAARAAANLLKTKKNLPPCPVKIAAMSMA
jgi:hypothetical protein